MIERLIVIVLVILSIGILVLSDFSKGRVYNCRDAHWHPDVPVEVKKECSRLMYENWKRKEDERKNEKGIHESRPDLLRT